MERESVEPAVLAVELIKEENRHRRRTSMFAVVGIGGILVGGGIATLAFQYLSETPTPEAAPPKLVATNPGLKPEQKAVSLYTEPKVEKPPETTPVKPEEPPKVAAKPSADPSGTMPFNPLSGAIISRSDVPENWQPGQEPPPAEEKPVVKEPAAKPQAAAYLVTARVNAGDPESEAAHVTATLQSAGASVRSAPHYNLAGGVIGVQIVATCPTASVEGLIAKLGGEKWAGSVEDRSGRVAGMISSRIRELRAKESQLKEKFEEDATEVAVVREEIQKLNQGLAMARSARSSGIAVIVIGIGSL